MHGLCKNACEHQGAKAAKEKDCRAKTKSDGGVKEKREEKIQRTDAAVKGDTPQAAHILLDEGRSFLNGEHDADEQPG